jgi:phosphatidylserine/phosphatidylglycerophosphate/cardiolipin synthase-like enzyme
VTSRATIVTAVVRTVEALAPGALTELIGGLRAGMNTTSLVDRVATSHYRDAVEQLLIAWESCDNISGEELALALECATASQERARDQTLSIVWTGPATDVVPLRRTDQVLLELVRSAEERLIVVSFAVYKVPELAEALVNACVRGVRVAIVLESFSESAGKVNFDMAAALGTEVARHATLYTWPADRRPETAAGTRASLHAKCAMSDARELLVSSANLTAFALTLNMELGLLVRGGNTPARVQQHFEQLILRGDLRVASGQSSASHISS